MAWRMAGFLLFAVLGLAVFCLGVLWLLGLLGEPATPISSLAWAAVLVLLAGMFLALVGGVRRLALPLGELIEAAGRVEQGDYSVRVAARGPRGLRLLGRAFNDMARRLEHTERQRRNLVADLSHELRTPVSVIQGNLEALLDGVYPADQAHLKPVLEEIGLLSRLIDDLRTLSEAETGTLALHREPTDLGVLLGELSSGYRPQAEAQGIDLRLEIDDELPLLEVDPVRMREVLVNLVSNALRHTDRGGEVVLSAAVEDDNGESRLALTVADNGSGVHPDDLPHIFERFYKATGDRSAAGGGRTGVDPAPEREVRPGGSGLGLTIAKNLVEAHGGTIEAESELGRGTSMRVSLPTGAD